MSATSKFYENLKKKVNQLQNEKKYQDLVEWNYKFTIQNVKNLYMQIEKIQRLFYSFIDLLWEKNIPNQCNFHFPGRTLKIRKFQTSYELVNDINFLITLSKSKAIDYISNLNGKTDEFSSYILPLFLSPLSINYFHKSLYKIMLPYFTSQQNQYLNDFEKINNLMGKLSTSLFENLCYFPDYLYDFLTKGETFFKKIKKTPKDIFREFALNIFFLRPDLIGIEADKNIIDDVFEKLDKHLDQPAEIFLASINPRDNGDLSSRCFELLPDTDDDNDAFNTTCIDDGFKYYYRQLLKISPKLPTELPEHLANTKNYGRIIKELVVRPGPQYLKRYKFYQKMENSQMVNKNILYQAVSDISYVHETEEIAKLSKLSVQLSNIQKITSKVIDNCKKMCLLVLKVDNMENDLSRYIEEPQVLIKNTQNLESHKKEIFSGLHSSDNIYKYLVNVIKFNAFIEHRKDILIADRSLETILESFKDHKFEITALYDFQKQNKREFNNLRNLFVKAFCESNDPLTKAKKISHAYTNIVQKVKLHIGVDVDTMNEDERNTFIFSVFCLFMPTKIISVYVFLTEFVFHSSYNKIFNNAPFENDLEEINLAKSILKSLINTCSNLSNLNGVNSFSPNFIYQCSNLSKICQENVNLKVMCNNEECEKLAIMSNPDYSMGNKEYDEFNVNDHNIKSLINYFQKIDSPKNIILRVYVDENKIYVCNISIVKDEKTDPLPKDRNEFIKYIQEHSEKNQKSKPK